MLSYDATLIISEKECKIVIEIESGKLIADK